MNIKITCSDKKISESNLSTQQKENHPPVMNLTGCQTDYKEQNGYKKHEIKTISGEANNNHILENFEGSHHLITRRSPIQDFYAGESVFITGGTGFVGKILIEKLLRTCPDISMIYLLIRSKHGKSAEHRIEELLQDRIYERLKREVPKFRDKIKVVDGECSMEYLGLSNADKSSLEREVSIVFHVAATVRFDETLKLATAINIRSTAEILDMCRFMPKLKAFIHVSTAYANCHVDHIDERFYACSMKYEDVCTLVNTLPDNTLDDITQRIIGKWPNTYTFTKAIAESLIQTRCNGLPIGIFRPGIVVSTAYEPIVGWVDNFYGATGITAAASSGVLRIMNCDGKSNANIVPVDLTVNALIASAWDVYTQTKKRDENMLIYNFVSSVDAPLTWTDYCAVNFNYSLQYPLSNVMWYTSLTMIKNKMLYLIAIFFLHLVPAFLLDTARVCVGKKPRFLKLYEKIHKFSTVISYFSTREWRFSNDNVQSMWQGLDTNDQQLFKFNMKEFKWSEYFTNYMKGIRIYLFHDELNTLEISRSRFRRLYWMHNAVKASVFIASGWICWNMYNLIWSRHRYMYF